MKKFKIYVTEPIPEIEIGFKLFENIAEIKLGDKFIGRVLPEQIEDVDAIIAGDSKISEESLKKAKRLKVIGRPGVGVDNVDLKACTERGILVFNVPGINADSVAEHVIGMILAISKKFLQRDNLARSGRWGERDKIIGSELKGKTIGIIGLGNVGSLVAKKAKGFEMKILAYDPYLPIEKAKELDVNIVDLPVLLRESDYISINCPLTDETRKMIGERELRLMKKDAILINTARGGIVDEDALYDALKEGWIRAAGIDVLENEPVSEHLLFHLDNVLLTPHSAGLTIEALRRTAMAVCEDILRVLKGELPKNLVNPEAARRREKPS